MPLYRVSVQKKVPATLEFLVRADSPEAAEAEAKNRNDPDSVSSLLYDNAEWLRTDRILPVDLNQEVSYQRAIEAEHTAELEEEEEEYNDFDDEEEDYASDEDDDDADDEPEPEDEDEDELSDTDETNSQADIASGFSHIELQASQLAATIETYADLPANTALAQVAAEILPPMPVVTIAEDDEETPEPEPVSDFGPDDANWTHNVVFSIHELREETRQVFDLLVLENLLNATYDEIWACSRHRDAVARLCVFLRAVPLSYNSDLAVRSRLREWARLGDRNMNALVNAVAVYGRETTECAICGLPGPTKLIQDCQGAQVGAICCYPGVQAAAAAV